MVRGLLPMLMMCVFVVVGCGGGDEPVREAASAADVDFPNPKGRTEGAFLQDIPTEAVFAPTTSLVGVRKNRVGFALFDVARERVEADAVALYTAKLNGNDVRGPYVARAASLEVKPPYRSEAAAADLEVNDTIWVAQVPFSARGRRVVFAVASVEGRLVSTDAFEYRVGAANGPPKPGDRAIRITTRTAADVAGDLGKISTRVPPPKEMLRTNFADVIGKKPVVLQFATPALCQTRVCGPVVDIAEQVRAEAGEGIVFIQQEIYNGNKVAKGFQRQVGQWRLPTEPWIFVIDRDGFVRERIEGAFSADELTRALAKVR